MSKKIDNIKKISTIKYMNISIYIHSNKINGKI